MKMKRTLRFLLLLVAMLALVSMSQAAMTGACEGGFRIILPCAN
jgi:hypothetical protein